MNSFKLILIIICSICNLQKHFVKGQAVSVTVSGANGFSPLQAVLNGISTFLQGNVIRERGNINRQVQYQQTSSNYGRPYTQYNTNNNHQQFGHWATENQNYHNQNTQRPNLNNFANNPHFNLNIGIGDRRHQQPLITNPFLNNYPAWNMQTSNLNSRPDITKSQTPWSSAQIGLVSEPAADPLGINSSQDGIISEIADDPLNIKNSRDCVIRETTENPYFEPNYTQNPSKTKPDIKKLPTQPPSPWSSSQSSLISEIAADPLGINNFQPGLVSEIVDDPLNLKNPWDGAIRQTTENPYFKPNYSQNPSKSKPDINKLPWSSSQSSSISETAADPLGIHNFQPGLVSEIVDDPLHLKNPRDGAIRQTTENPYFKPNYSQNPSKTKPDINKLPTQPPSPWSSSQSSLISETAAYPLGINNFQPGLISEIVDDPLNLKNTRVKNPVTHLTNNNNNFPTFSTTAAPLISSFTSTTHNYIPAKPKPGTIINPDSPYYIPADSDGSLESLIDIRIN